MLATRELFDGVTVGRLESEDLAAAIDSLLECQGAVTACAAAMLDATDTAGLMPAVRRDMDCADVVEATQRVLTRADTTDMNLLRAQLAACAVACEHSHELCSRHAAQHDFCRICAEATRNCMQMCRRLINELSN
ncbi:four-helix bundle copper-binding protein [Actinomadura rupiterrae]|uniref:four-helix bundle copper-binding protein n=1 Tax=Actinomadura rupiterrae TaxID=559627 RepID=UPI0020A367F0|nr:four-helix bundle copper-binding protein [Actinomadura rupiterrae]MCP2337746.1 methylthioribose-1-phosphate isomerase [Actinomadura rupiterrae]